MEEKTSDDPDGNLRWDEQTVQEAVVRGPGNTYDPDNLKVQVLQGTQEPIFLACFLLQFYS